MLCGTTSIDFIANFEHFFTCNQLCIHKFSTAMLEATGGWARALKLLGCERRANLVVQFKIKYLLACSYIPRDECIASVEVWNSASAYSNCIAPSSS